MSETHSSDQRLVTVEFPAKNISENSLDEFEISEEQFIAANEMLVNINITPTIDELRKSILDIETTLRLVKEEKKSLQNIISKAKLKKESFGQKCIELNKELEKLKKGKNDLEAKIKSVDANKYILKNMEQLYIFLEENFCSKELPDGKLTMTDLIEKLIQKRMTDEPYIDTDAVWPPHVEFLLHFNIAQHKPNCPKQICLVPCD